MNRYWWLIACLAPVLGATTTIIQALSITTCLAVLIALHQLLMLPLRNRLEPTNQLWASLILSIALTSILQLGLRAWALPLALSLGHYPLLLAVQALAFDRLLPANDRWRASLTTLAGLLAACLALAIGRQVLADGLGLHLAQLTPGALMLLGLLLGLYNHLRRKPTSARRQGTL
ncbi:Rnf-Nqr domain containing protein [Pseudomonas sp. UFMG81]|jgi:electron transport complex protein RnfE|uniref:Rnf-Nqr domain containing protein n=1 Tax=Pseudomonas sp. UFMG81 TaxID=2745936 RepID=UPI0018908113|nr:Rnf-Nqr domain containing protein [Pseudomonas sp. UFMG81]